MHLCCQVDTSIIFLIVCAYFQLVCFLLDKTTLGNSVLLSDANAAVAARFDTRGEWCFCLHAWHSGPESDVNALGQRAM